MARQVWEEVTQGRTLNHPDAVVSNQMLQLPGPPRIFPVLIGQYLQSTHRLKAEVLKYQSPAEPG
jgi:hypothetical protein